MNVWRLMGHHDPAHKDTAMRWSRANGALALGWGETGSLRQRAFRDERELADIVYESYKPRLKRTNAANGGRSLWRFYREAQVGDLVILRTNSDAQTMRISGDYYYAADEYPIYEHRRRADPVSIDPRVLWAAAGGRGEGQSPFLAFLRCAKPVASADL